METNNELNQNPEKLEKSAQEENSEVKTESKDQQEPDTESKFGTKKKVKKSTASDKKEKVEENAVTSKPSAEPADKETKPKAATKKKKKEEPVAESSKEDKAKEKTTKKSVVKEKPAKEVKEKTTKTSKKAAASTKETESTEEPIAAPQPVSEEPGVKSEKSVPEEQTDTKEDVKDTASDPPKKENITKDEMKEVSGDVEEDHDDNDEEPHEEEVAEVINYNELSLEEIVSMLEEIVNEGEIESIRKKVALIKVAFLKKHKLVEEEHLESKASDKDEDSGEGSGIIIKDELQIRFNEAFKVYSIKRKAYLEEQEKLKQTNLESKKLILEELKALVESEESLKKTYDDFKILQDKWKSIGMVPKAEVNNLWQNYHFYVEKFFDKVKINKELRDLDLKKNFESKINLCEKAEELLLETSVLKSFKQLQQYHRQWKEIGPVPQDKKDDLWERFKNATEKINEARREHYNKLKDTQKNNLEAKTALCEKAEEILQIENTSIKEWQENTEKVTELLKVWKTIGQAPRVDNDKIWERFKTSLDIFFAGKKEYFQQIKGEQLNNYNLKLDLCAQAEAIKTSTDWKKTTQELINLQKDWKKIGPVPRKHSDKIWKRFRAACDEFFNSKSEYYSNIKSHESDNLKAKEDLIKKIESFEYGKDKNENLEVLKGFQREWSEIGHVPFKEKDKIQNTFRNAINAQLDKLKISKAEMQTVNYRQRFENLKDNPNARKIISNERHFLQQKAKKLEDEIQLLENNMGFLAQSKKADLLKAEFLKKIDDARNEVKVIREKIRFLEKEGN